MDKKTPWGLQRYGALVLVAALHLALIWALLLVAGTGHAERTTVQPVELLLLPIVIPPRVRSESARPRRMSVTRTREVVPNALGTLAMATPPSSASVGDGAGVDWAAEARRALHAYEIRNHRPPRDTLVSGESEDEWLRQLEHHNGDQVRTPNGDWIIWISADCYQVARSGTSVYGAGTTLPQTLCLDRSASSGR